MRLMDRPIASARLLGGRLCLDFVNTCGGRRDNGGVLEDRLLGFEDLAAWAYRAGLESGPTAQRMVTEAAKDPQAAARIWERAVNLRDTSYRMLRNMLRHKPPVAADVATLNREWTEALRHRSLAAGSPCLQLKWTNGNALDRTLWAVAESTAQVLASRVSLERLRECGGLNCGWLFEDSSRNGRRQWCDMQMCGTAAKVRRFRERKKEQS